MNFTSISKRVGILFISLLAVSWSAMSHAGTGTITTTTPHLTIAAGHEATGNFSWTTTGETTAQVYISVNGGADLLNTTGPSGSNNPPWFVPGNDYVIKLYEGTSHTNLLAYTSISTQYPPASQFGMDYYPAGQDSEILYPSVWASQQQAVTNDAAQMASMGVKVVRVFLFADKCEYIAPNWPPSSLPCPSSSTAQFPIETNGMLTSLTGSGGLLAILQSHGIKVIFVLANQYQANGPKYANNMTPSCLCWQGFYGPNNYSAFLSDTVRWVRDITSAVASSPYSNDVLYYDYANEYTDPAEDPTNAPPNNPEYLQYLYDQGRVPMGERGVSLSLNDVGFIESFGKVYTQRVNALKTDLNGRHLDYLDIHYYSENSADDPANLQYAYDAAQTIFGDSTLLLGETGTCSNVDYTATPFAPNYSGELSQQTADLGLFNDAISLGFSYYLNWMLYDNTPNPKADTSCTGGFPSFGFEDYQSSQNTEIFNLQPKDIMGGLASQFSLVPNPDMESVSGGALVNWFVGGIDSVSLVSMGPLRSDAATNDYYARVIATSSQGASGYLRSKVFGVQGGAPIYMDAFIRTNMSSVFMELDEYDINMNLITTDTGPTYTPSSSSTWENYLQQVGSWNVTLNSNTARAILVIYGSSNLSTALLDVDTVTVSQ